MDIFELRQVLRQLTKPRIKKRELASSSLRSLAMQAIVSDANFYWIMGSITRCNPFSPLPDTVKTELLGALLKRQDSVNTEEHGTVSAIQWLLNPTVTKFTFPHFHFRESRYSDLWKVLTLRCPHLQTVSWTLGGSNRNVAHRANFFSSMVQFRDLQAIHMHDFICDDLDLCRLAANLPKLRSLDICFSSDVSSLGINALSKLEHFQDLQFGLNAGTDDTVEMFFLLCIQRLPTLHSIQFKLLYTSSIRHTCKFTASALRRIREELTLALKTLFLEGEANPSPNLLLPNLETLYLLKPSTEFFPDERFSKLTELSLHDADPNVCDRILRSVGRQLQTLSISVTETLALDVLVRECPNLEQLSIEQDEKDIVFHEPFILKKLRKLHVSIKDFEANHLAQNFQPGLLMALLRCPQLHDVSFECTNLSEEDAAAINFAVLNNSILQQVESFVFHTARKSEVFEEFQEQYADYIKRVQTLLINVAMYCPRVTNAL
ncbi:uncharacterized protein LOC135937279 [Cloeon dipterum]|uniref:uncharacterized protein LOC135937279 n=1 Tax=Cloeon dipterum TaxID=197152 RepID=UPI00321F7DDD